jgi:hypothetical protein
VDTRAAWEPPRGRDVGRDRQLIKLGSAGDGVAGDDTYVYWIEEEARADGAVVLLRARWSGGGGQVVSRAAR